MSSPFEIVGFTSTDFDPGWIADVRFGAGGLAAGSALLVCMLVGNMTSAGSMTANSSVEICFDQTQANSLAGPGSELARGFEWAVKVPGAVIYLVPNTESGGANATATITFATNASSAGTWIYYVGGRLLQVAVASGDTPTVQGDTAVAFVNAHPEFGYTAANVTGTVTLTWKQKGPRGNDVILRQDQSQKPTGTTSTIATAGTVITANIMIRFGGGTTADDITTVATNTFAGWYHRPALAARDATNLGVWETSMDAKAAWNEQHPQHTTVFSNTAALATVQSLTQTTLNNQRFCFCWAPNGEQDPFELASFFAAYRSVAEQSDPGRDYDGLELPGALPYARPADNPQRSTRVAALRTGVTPIYATNSTMTIRRAITTRCLDGSNADYKTLDVGTAYVPDFIRFDIGLLWLAFKAKNPVIRDNMPPELGDPPQGVATPDMWNRSIMARLKEHESGATVTSRLPQLSDVDANPPSTIWVGTTGQEHFASAIPVVPAKRQHQATAVILQH